MYVLFFMLPEQALSCLHDLRNGTVFISVFLPVFSMYQLPHAAAAGLLLRVCRLGSIDRVLHDRHSAANASSVIVN